MSVSGEKRIYLAGRHPDLTPEQFTKRWRNHFRLASTRPRWRNIQRYWQYDPLPPARTPGHDAIAQLWFRSAEAARRHFLEADDQAVMEADEREIFSEMIRDRILSVRETVGKPGPAGGVVLFRFFRRQPGIPFTHFAASYEAYAQHLAAILPDSARFTWNVDVHGGEREGGLDADAVDEIHFSDQATAQRFARATDLTGSPPDGAVVSASVMTVPVPLYDIEHNPPAA